MPPDRVFAVSSGCLLGHGNGTPMNDKFLIDVSDCPDGRVCVVSLTGKLDPLAVEQLDLVVNRLYEGGHRYFVFDLTRLVYVGSVGLRVFVELANRVRANGYLGVCNVTAQIRQLFDMTKISTIVRIFPSRADALDAARSH